jgi:hypothetical protein
MMSKFQIWIMIIGLYAIAAGTIGMAYEQKRANSGIFIDPNALQAQSPTDNSRHL